MANESVIPEDFDSMKKDYLCLKKELDEANQELYACRRQLKVQEALHHEFQNEIDMLQSDELRQKQKYQEAISHLEESISNLRVNYGEQIHTLETALVDMEEKNVALEAELDLVKKTNTSMTFSGDTSKLIEEILSLKEDHEGISENRNELVTMLEDVRYSNSLLEKALSECREESLSLKEILDCKREELNEANNLNQKLNDDIVCLKTELETFKTQPLDEKSKGNSLFAEVDDRRVYLQDTINKMKSDYVAMKQERSQHLNTIHQLKLENMRLLDKWKSDYSEKKDDENEVTKSLQYRTNALENLIEKYKKDLEAKPVVLHKNNFEEIQYYQVVLKNKNKEISELRDQISSRSLTQLLLSSSLKEASEEKRKWRLEAISKQHELDKLNGHNSQIEEKAEKPDEKKAFTFMRSDNVTRRTTNDRSSFLRSMKELRKTTDTNNLDIKRSDDRISYNQFQRRSEREIRSDALFQPRNLIKKIETEKRNEIINIGESNDDIGGGIIEKTHCSRLPEEKKELVDNEEMVKIKDETNEDKENVKGNVKTEQPRKVTFSETTVSPKKNNGARLRTCKRVIVAKPLVYFSSKPDEPPTFYNG